MWESEPLPVSFRPLAQTGRSAGATLRYRLRSNRSGGVERRGVILPNTSGIGSGIHRNPRRRVAAAKERDGRLVGNKEFGYGFHFEFLSKTKNERSALSRLLDLSPIALSTPIDPAAYAEARALRGCEGMAGVMPARCARRTKSGTELAPSFCMARPR